jgi:hypothetical protein
LDFVDASFYSFFTLRSRLREELRTSAFLELAIVEMEQEALAFENSRSISGRPWTDKNRKNEKGEKDEKNIERLEEFNLNSLFSQPGKTFPFNAHCSCSTAKFLKARSSRR